MVDEELLAVFMAEVDDQIDDLCRRLEAAPSGWRVQRLFQLSHNIKGAARIVGIDEVRDAAHALEDLFTAVRDGALPADHVAALARRGAGLLEASFQAITTGKTVDLGSFRHEVDEMVSSGAAGAGADAEPAAQDTAAGSTPEQPVPAAASAPEPAEELPAQPGSETIRVGVDKLDGLMGLSSEVVAQVFQAEEREQAARQLAGHVAAVLGRWPALRTDPDMLAIAQLSKELRQRLAESNMRAVQISEELQGSVRLLRMVRFDGIANLLSRSLREALHISQRQAQLQIHGGHTEVDRAVLTHLRDPLTHLIRNAVCHGIESPQARRAVGKSESGMIALEVRSVGAWVEVAVSDDGGGIDPAKIFDHAVSKGLVSPEEHATLSEEKILDLLAQPGFSTAATVNELAGRGVGLDVVRSMLAEIGGSVSISSRLGEGTRVTLRVPLTRLTTQAIACCLGEQHLAVPIADVERIVTVNRREISTVDGVDVLEMESCLTPVSHLAALLGLAPSTTEILPALVLSDGRRRRAVLVDEVLGERELIIQPLSWNLRGAQGLAGTSIIGERVVLVLDSHELVQAAWIEGAAGQARYQPSKEVERPRILVVDDSVTARTLEANILSTAGYEVITAVNGAEAWDLFESHKIDLVVADVRMPEMDGLELARKIRSSRTTKDLPVVLVTSLGNEADKHRGAEAGADAYIVKGEFDQEDLLRTISRLL